MSSKSNRVTKRASDNFLQGFACAVAALARDHDQPTMAVDIMRCNGVTWYALVKAGTDSFDLPKKLRNEWRREHERIRRSA